MKQVYAEWCYVPKQGVRVDIGVKDTNSEVRITLTEDMARTLLRELKIALPDD